MLYFRLMIFDVLLFSDFESDFESDFWCDFDCDFDMAWSSLGDCNMAMNDFDVILEWLWLEGVVPAFELAMKILLCVFFFLQKWCCRHVLWKAYFFMFWKRVPFVFRFLEKYLCKQNLNKCWKDVLYCGLF